MTSITVRLDDDVKRDAEILFDNLGLSISGAINVFFRQAIREQAIPFQIKAKTADEKYNEYFIPQVVEQVKKSIAQAERGEVITFTLDELMAMEDGDIPERGIEFLRKHKKAEAEANA